MSDDPMDEPKFVIQRNTFDAVHYLKPILPSSGALGGLGGVFSLPEIDARQVDSMVPTWVPGAGETVEVRYPRDTPESTALTSDQLAALNAGERVTLETGLVVYPPTTASSCAGRESDATMTPEEREQRAMQRFLCRRDPREV